MHYASVIAREAQCMCANALMVTVRKVQQVATTQCVLFRAARREI